MSQIKRAVIYASLSKYTVKLVSLVSTILTARLLSPSEIGVFFIASALVFVISQLQMIAGSAYLVREKEVDAHTTSSALRASIIVCWAIALSVLLISLGADQFFEIDGISGVFAIFSLSFLLMPYVPPVGARLKLLFHKLNPSLLIICLFRLHPVAGPSQ